MDGEPECSQPDVKYK